MHSINFDELNNIPEDYLQEKIEELFHNLVQEIKSYLNLDLAFTDISISMKDTKEQLDEQNTDFINFGVQKTYVNRSITISLSTNYRKYIPILLLREAYKCFIPQELHENIYVNVFIDQKVEIDLKNLEIIGDWKELKRKYLISYDFKESQFDRLEKFLGQETTEDRPGTFQFFLSFLRKNVQIIGNIKDGLDFYDIIYEEYVLKQTDYSNDMLETIRVIFTIFSKVKSYDSLMDYQHYFQEFKDSGFIQTNLSLRKFTDNMQWINNFSDIAPTYQINWTALKITTVMCFLKFHPLLEVPRILKIVTQLPFFRSQWYSKYDFGVDVFGYFHFPDVYLKDVIGLLERLENDGYLIDKKVYILSHGEQALNLNCFKSRTPILNPNRHTYNQEYELGHRFDYHGTLSSNLSLLDWLLFDRISNISIVGFGFERKSEILKKFKSDLLTETDSQRDMISEIKKRLNEIHKSPDLRNEIIKIIDTNKSYGFHYIYQILDDYITASDVINNFLSQNPNIHNFYEFQDFITKHGIFGAIEDNIILKKVKKEILRFYFKSKGEFIERIKHYHKFIKLFKSFSNLKIFNLDSIKSIITEASLIQTIYKSKEQKLQSSYERYKKYKITYKLIEQRIDDFLHNDPPVIVPSLIGSITAIVRFSRYTVKVVLKNSLRSRENIKILKKIFPKVVKIDILEYKNHKEYIYIHLHLPNLKIKEKQGLYSTLYTLFQEDIIIAKRYFINPFLKPFSIKNFYDHERKEFFYTKDLFEQFYPFIQHTLNFDSSVDSSHISEIQSDLIEKLWGKQSITQLIHQVENFTSKEQADFNISELNNLIGFHANLRKNLLDVENFKNAKSNHFFRTYINSIKFIPSFQSFGLGHYFLYFYPSDLREIDFRHILHNAFQKIKYPARIDPSNSFFIQYIWPYRNPNNKALNWLTKSKKAIREYCLFFTKKVFQIFHLDYNLSANKWDIDPNHFKAYFQNVLFNPNYKDALRVKTFNIGDLPISTYFTPKSPEFKTLTELYNWKSSDLKSYLGTPYKIVSKIVDLIEKNLIFPFLTVKNLDLREKLYIILPEVRSDHHDKLIRIFSFFNLGFIHEIEGEYFIQGFPEQIKFENGLMIKLYLPDCQLEEFQKNFDLLFEYLEIKHYIILNDLVDGKDLLKSIYGDIDFLEKYNPLKNLKWNEKDKIWMNHKLFTENFEKIYPELLPDNEI